MPRTTKLEPGLRPASVSTTSSPSYHIEAGDVEAALAAADVVLEGEYRVGHQEQLYIENNAMIAVPTEGGGVTVTGSLQCPYYLHKALKRGLGLDDDAARVVQAETGGGFGGKEEFPSVIALHAALLARKAQQAGPDDLRPPRGHRGDDQAPPGDRPPPDRRRPATGRSSPRTSRSSWTAARTAR